MQSRAHRFSLCALPLGIFLYRINQPLISLAANICVFRSLFMLLTFHVEIVCVCVCVGARARVNDGELRCEEFNPLKFINRQRCGLHTLTEWNRARKCPFVIAAFSIIPKYPLGHTHTRTAQPSERTAISHKITFQQFGRTNFDMLLRMSGAHIALH